MGDRLRRLRALGVVIAAAAAIPTSLARADAAGNVNFTKHVAPILAEHCTHCHGRDAETRQGGLRLDLRDPALVGGDSGRPAIVVGRPDESEMIRRIRSTDHDEIMPPPHENKPLTPEKMAILEAWITQGAEYARHWAFERPRKTSPPRVAGVTQPIDAFVRANLAAENLAPTPRADDATLCRRLHLDIVGLPPSPADLEAFMQDSYEQTVDRLLASERFGEKWARPWLDLARYSDTNGYEKDMPREMWAWRDWVVAALNRDQPYDQFIVEQIAGDLLPGATQDQIVATGFLRNSMLNEEGAIIPEEFRMAEMFDRVDCIGKAVLGLTTGCAQCHNHKFDPLSHEEYFGLFAFFNDTYESRSYVYTPAQLGELAELRGEIAAAEEEIRRLRPTWQTDMEAWAAEAIAGLPDWQPLAMDEMSSSGLLNHPSQRADGSILMIGHRDDESLFEAVPDLVGVTGLQLEALTDGDLFMKGPGRDGSWRISRLRVQIRRPGANGWEDLRLVNATADFSEAEQMLPRPQDYVPQSVAPQRGAAGAGQPAGAPAATVPVGPVTHLIDGDEYSAWRTDRGHLLRHQPAVAVVQFERPLDLPSGTRLKIAVKWSGGTNRDGMLGCCRLSLTKSPAPAAPPIDHAAILAARVAVNQIWQVLFGQGLAETPDDFGARAPVPEYIELLDWLAVDFMEQGWSRKQMIRQIVMSETYRQSSRATPEALARDPLNRLLARGPRFRPDAEVIRDTALAVSGLLTEKLGGPSIYPPVPQNVLDYNFTKIDWPVATGPDRYRRSLYLFRRRSMPDPALATFDAPGGDVSCSRRVRSNTPLAALTGLNEPVFVEAAQALALRTLHEGGPDDASRIDHAFLLCASRRPSAAEKRELLSFLEAQREKLVAGALNPYEVATGSAEKRPALPPAATPQDAAAWTLVARVLLNLDETMTKN